MDVLYCHWGTLKRGKKPCHLGLTGSNKKASYGCFSSVCAQILHKAHFQENCDHKFNLQFCLFEFLPAKNSSTILVVFRSLNWIKGSFVLCVFFCHFQLHFFLNCSIHFSLRELSYFCS